MRKQITFPKTPSTTSQKRQSNCKSSLYWHQKLLCGIFRSRPLLLFLVCHRIVPKSFQQTRIYRSRISFKWTLLKCVPLNICLMLGSFQLSLDWRGSENFDLRKTHNVYSTTVHRLHSENSSYLERRILKFAGSVSQCVPGTCFNELLLLSWLYLI